MSVHQTALFACHQRLGAHMVEFAHTLLPLKYDSEKAEHKAVREALGIFDVSHMGEFLISGKNSPEFLNKILTNNWQKLKPGFAQYTLMLNEKAGIIDDLILYYFGENRFMLCVNAANILRDWQWLNQQAQNIPDLTIDNASKLFSQIALQGPKSAALLKELTSEPLPESFGIKELLIDNIACLCARTGYTGEDGFEIFLSNSAAEHIYNYLLEKGQKWGIKPCGLAARDSLRLEAGMKLHGVDINENTTPLEAHLMFAVDLKKADFIGKNILTEQILRGPRKILTGFKLLERGIARHGFKIFDNEGKALGEVSSGSWPVTQQYGIGLAYIAPEYNKEGQEILINIRGRTIKAVVTKNRFR